LMSFIENIVVVTRLPGVEMGWKYFHWQNSFPCSLYLFTV
jgi:hypothetical protein